ncbi:hypothetical protein [Sinimarinibacterium sp. CAU 1509]|uniref:hypothetical protein n=1 Tax=Sinimarinibacterium sp. CAU 1509 TaxID=2562283 RepID=UPI001B7FD26B|nr:hypothetical protein [Sinimarinibacterium sp. CAU 1509]
MSTIEHHSDVEHLAERTSLNAADYFDAQLHAAVDLALKHWPLLREIATRDTASTPPSPPPPPQ